MIAECKNFEINVIKFEIIIAFVFLAINNKILNDDNIFVYFENVNTKFLMFENWFSVFVIIQNRHKIFCFVFVILIVFRDEIELNLLIIHDQYKFEFFFIIIDFDAFERKKIICCFFFEKTWFVIRINKHFFNFESRVFDYEIVWYNIENFEIIVNDFENFKKILNFSISNVILMMFNIQLLFFVENQYASALTLRIDQIQNSIVEENDKIQILTIT